MNFNINKPLIMRMFAKKKTMILWQILITVVIFTSCEPVDEQEVYEEKLVVFGNLTANSPVTDTFYVSLSAEVTASHETGVKWIDSADILITSATDSFYLQPVPGNPGRYLDTTYSHNILPNTTYYLNVNYEEYSVMAETTVPDYLTLKSVKNEGWFCQGNPVVTDSIDLHLTENTPFLIQQAFLMNDFSILVMDTVAYREDDCYTASFMSPPFFSVQWESETAPGLVRFMSLALDDSYENAIVDTSLSANAFKGPMFVSDTGELYRQNPLVWNLSQPMLDFSWLSFNYYGPHLLLIQAMDQAYHDYYVGDPMGMNQYLLPNSNIIDGYGLFSSMNSVGFFVYIAPDTTR